MTKKRNRTRSVDSKPAAEQPDGEPQQGASGRLSWVLLGLVLMTSAVAVAGAFIPAPHNGGDNAGYVSLAYSLLEHGRYLDLYDPGQLPHTKYPPVFPGLLAFLNVLGVRTWGGLKLVAAVSTVAAVGFTYLWARRRIDPVWAAGVAVIVAFSSGVVYYSHWVLSDPTFLAFTMASLWMLGEADEDGAHLGWLIGGVVAAGLAYFTRSAGLPLLVALFGWLLVRRRWRAAAGSALALGLPALFWWLRARGVGDVQYVNEFWLVDPYDPSLGTVGVGGLLVRAVSNAGTYIGAHIPGGIVGGQGAFLTGLGLLLVGLALAGWFLRARRRPGPAEFFMPLYAGLILLWPAVWSGDRFALPLIPVLLVFSAVAIRRGVGEGVLRRALGVMAFLVLLLPAVGTWTGSMGEASACAAVVRQSGAFACYGPRMTQFAEAATWAGGNLPEGSAVMSRKPRIFFVLSGVPSRTFPFDTSVETHLAEADAVGARYVLLDQVDNLAGRYVGSAVQQQPGAFCFVEAFGEASGPRSQLLGLVDVADRGAGSAPAADGSVRIGACGVGFVTQPPPNYSSSSNSTRIPLLDGLDP